MVPGPEPVPPFGAMVPNGGGMAPVTPGGGGGGGGGYVPTYYILGF